MSDPQKSHGVIYVLTNPSFPEYVKIGYADDLRKRLDQLNRSECLPFAFRVYCTYEVEGRLKDKDVHHLIDMLNPDLRSIETFDGRPRVREFYNMGAEDAFEILSTIAKISGTSGRLCKYSPEGHEILDEKVAEEIQMKGAVEYTEESHLKRASASNIALYKKLREQLLALPGVSLDPKKLYIAFKTENIFCDVQVLRNSLKIFLNVHMGTLEDPAGLAVDVHDKGHWGCGDYLVYLDDEELIPALMDLIRQSYDANCRDFSHEIKLSGV